MIGFLIGSIVGIFVGWLFSGPDYEKQPYSYSTQKKFLHHHGWYKTMCTHCGKEQMLDQRTVELIEDQLNRSGKGTT